MLRTCSAGRLTAVRSCPPHVSRVLQLLGLPADYLPAGDWATPASATSQLTDRLRRARLDGREANLGARLVLTRLADTRIRLSSTQERNAL